MANNAYLLNAVNNGGKTNTLNPNIQSGNSAITAKSLPTGNFSQFQNLSQVNGGPVTLGKPAKSPEQNISKPTNTLTPAQTASKTGLLQTASANKMATLYGDNGQKKPVGIGSPEASQLQSQGWGLTPGSYKTPAPIDPNAGYDAALKAEADKKAADINAGLKPDTTTGGALGNLSKGVIGNTYGTTTTNSANQGLLDISKNNPGNSGPAYQDLQAAKDELAAYQNKMQMANAGLGNAGNSLQAVTGQQLNMNTANAGILANLQGKVATAQTAINQQVSGQQTQQNALASAGGIGQTQQTNLQSGLGSVVGYTQPLTPGYNTPVYTRDDNGNLTLSNPGGTGSSAMSQLPQQAQNAIQSFASQVKNNQLSRADAESRLSAYGQGGINALNEALGSNFNTNISSGANSAQTNAAGQQAQQIQSWTSSLQQGQNLKAQFTDLISKFGLNPADLNAANQGLQKIANNVSDPNYQNFHNYVADIANTYANILTPAGGSVTNQTRDISNSLLNATMSGTGLLNVMNTLDQQAQAKIAGVSTSGGLGGGTSSNSADDSKFNW